MTYREFLSNYINPHLTDDKGANNQLFNDVKDSLRRDGQITEKQAQNWSQPNNLKFRTHQELKKPKTYFN